MKPNEKMIIYAIVYRIEGTDKMIMSKPMRRQTLGEILQLSKLQGFDGYGILNEEFNFKETIGSGKEKFVMHSSKNGNMLVF